MNAIVTGILDGAKEAARDFVSPTVSFVKGGMSLFRQVANASWSGTAATHRGQAHQRA